MTAVLVKAYENYFVCVFNKKTSLEHIERKGNCVGILS